MSTFGEDVTATTLSSSTYPSWSVPTWTNPLPEQINDFAYSPSLDLLIAVGEGDPSGATVGNQEAYGYPFTGVAHPMSASNFGQGNGCCWAEGLGLFVMVGYPSGNAPSRSIATSPDGITWTRRSSALDGNGNFGNQVAWSESQSLLVTVGYTTGSTHRIFTSADGATWTPRSSPISGASTNAPLGVAYSPTLDLWLVTVRHNTFPSNPITPIQLLSSTNGTTWTTVSSAVLNDQTVSRVRWSTLFDKFLIGASGGLKGEGSMFSSPDGTNWTTIVNAFDNDATFDGSVDDFCDVNDDRIYAVGLDANQDAAAVQYSFDLETWTLADFDFASEMEECQCCAWWASADRSIYVGGFPL